MSPTTQGAPSPTLIDDGDCESAEVGGYWERLTGARVVYRPYQDAAQDYPDIPLDTFRHAISSSKPTPTSFRCRSDGPVPALRARTARMVVYACFRGLRPWRWATRSLRVAATC
jgi:hypothetical protein